MDSARRGTMQPPPEPFGFNRSNIPIPASTVKKPTTAARLRQSIAPPPPSSNPRNSLFPTQGNNPLLLSASKAAYGKTPLRNSSNRRDSRWAMGSTGRPSMLPPSLAATHSVRDPRAIREKSVQQNMRAAIFNWLVETEISNEITKQTLSSCTAKDFKVIFDHLVGLIDPHYDFGLKGIKFEDEVLRLLKAFRYPFADSIDKNWLKTPASMHSWPSLLASLHWMVGLSKVRLAHLDSDDPTLQSVEHLPEEFDDPNHHFAIAYEYYKDAYAAFLAGANDFVDQNREVEERYAKKNQHVLADLEVQRDKFNKQTALLAHLTSQPAPLRVMSEENEHKKSDMMKFEDVLQHYRNRRKKLEAYINQDKQQIAADTAELDNRRREHERLLGIVAQQNMSPEEVARMNHDHESLQRNLEEMTKKSAEISQSARGREITMAIRMESIEHAIDEYTNLLHRLGLAPKVLPPLPPADLRIETYFASSNLNELVKRKADNAGVDFKGDIMPSLHAIGFFKRQRRQESEDELLTASNELDQVNQDCERKEDETGEVEGKVARVEQEAKDLHDAAQREVNVSNTEVARLEKELGNAKVAAMASGVGVISRVNALQIAYQEQVERVDRLRDETVKAILKSSGSIAAFKVEVSSRLTQLREFAEEN